MHRGCSVQPRPLYSCRNVLKRWHIASYAHHCISCVDIQCQLVGKLSDPDSPRHVARGSSNYTGRKYFIPCLCMYLRVIFVASLLSLCVYSISVYVRAFSIFVCSVCMFRAVTLDLIRSLRPALGGVRDSSFLSPLQL